MTSHKEDDLYEDFNYSIEIENATASAVSFANVSGNDASDRGPRGTALMSSYGNKPVFSRAGVATGGVDARPMTSISGAGYKSESRGTAFDPLKQGKATEIIDITKKPNASNPEEIAKGMERQIHRLLEESADFAADRDLLASLDRAKEAGKRERVLCRHKEQNGMSDSVDVELTYSVCFCLADAYYRNKQYEESLSTYSIIIKSRLLSSNSNNALESAISTVRVRTNMGNIYYDQKKYPSAIKMYRMALDPLPPSDFPQLRRLIFSNIASCFIRMGQYQDAISSFDTIVSSSDDRSKCAISSLFNLVLCYHCLDEGEMAQVQVANMISIRSKLDDDNNDVDDMILTCCRLLSSSSSSSSSSFHDWISSTIKTTCSSSSSLDLLSSSSSALSDLSSRIDMDYALTLLKTRQFDEALTLLRSFHDSVTTSNSIKATSSINLSFLYFLEGDIRTAEEFANIALTFDRYSAKALVNKGNCLLVKYDKTHDDESLERAKELYLEAIGVEADCSEAIYNLGLVYKRQGNAASAKQAFDKLYAISPHDVEVQLQIALLFEAVGNNAKAIKWLEQVHAHLVNPDPYLAARIGQAYGRQDDETLSLHWHMTSHSIWPIDLDVISWLGVWFVRNEMFDRASEYFVKAAIIQPSEVKWRLMIASCYRRCDNLKAALDVYLQTHGDFMDNVESLKYIVSISREIGRPCKDYLDKLDRLAPGSVSSMTTTNNERSTANVVSASNQGRGNAVVKIDEGNDDVDVGALLE